MKHWKTLLITLFLCAFTLGTKIAAQPCPGANPVQVITTSNAVGQRNLQWAVGCINTVPTLSRIDFNIPGAGPHIIQPGVGTPIPVITKNNAWIDGTTDSIIIDGSSSGNPIAFDVNATGFTIEAIYIRNYNSGSGAAVQLRFGSNHLINANRLSGNHIGLITLGNVINFTATNNVIGLSNTGTAQGNANEGILIQGSLTSAAMEDNTIAHNMIGVNILGGGNTRILDNSFYCNSSGGILRPAGPTVPSITTATPTTVSGTSTANAAIQVFKHNNNGCSAGTPCQGKTHIGNTTANASGNWTLSLAAGILLGGERVTATATIGGLNTSAFNNACLQVSCSSLALTATPTAVACFGQNNGSITLNISGGNPSFMVGWSGPVAGSASTAANTYTISNLPPGSYTITVLEANGCSATATSLVTQPSAAVSVSGTDIDIRCFGEATGAISITASGGSGTYTYDWADLPGINNIEDRMGLTAGTYTVVVADANGCSAISSYTISQPSAALDTIVAITPVNCFGQASGAIALTSFGGTPPYNFDWADLPGTINPEDRTGLLAGSYMLTITDANTCTLIGTHTVPGPVSALGANAMIANVSCFGDNTGAIALTLSGGTPPYNFDWADLPGSNNPEDRSGLSAGAYFVTITDANLCTLTGTHTVLGPLSALDANAVGTNVSCSGDATGSIAITVIGGTEPYSFDWADLPGSNNPEDRMGLAAGNYSVTITDINNCQTTASALITQPAPIDIGASIISPPCMGGNTGAINITASGGTPPYTYDWADLPGLINQEDRTDLPVGIYTVTITDINSCQASNSSVLSSPGGLIVSFTQNNLDCFGDSEGSINLTVTGGLMPYSFDWADLPGNNDPEDRNNLAAGLYQVTVSDVNGCSFITPGILITQPDMLSLTMTPSAETGVNTGDGSIAAIVAGGTPPYEYFWSVSGSGAQINNLPPGQYGLTVTDFNDCEISGTATVLSFVCSNFAVSLSGTNIDCFGGNEGAIQATTINGSEPIEYLWNNGDTLQNLSGLTAGVYHVLATDAAGCEARDTLVLTQAPALNLNIATTPETNPGAGDGTATAQVSGGTPPYNYDWTPSNSGETITNLSPGTYTCTITDANDCSITASGTVNLASCAGFSVSITTAALGCNGQQNGSASANATGGTLPLNYLWSNGDTTAAITNLSAGSIGITVTDFAGCVTTDESVVGQAASPPQPAYALYSPAEVCGNTPFTLRADDLYPHPSDVEYIWILPNGDTLRTNEPELELIAGSTAYSGQYFVIRDSLGCLSLPVGGAPLEVLSLAPGQLGAGADTVLCGNAEQALLRAFSPPQSLGRWQSLGLASVADPLLATSEVNNLQPGANIFVWKVSIANCPQAAADTVVIFSERSPEVEDDHYLIERVHDIAVMHVLLNDHLEGMQDTTVTVVSGPDIGNLEWLPGPRQFRYQAEENFRGLVQFQYQVCNQASACGALCAIATVTIEVLNLPVVPEGLIYHSGNENERLFIKGIDGFSSIEITITDRWGDIVFYEKNYSNEKPWMGENQQSGRPLPQGAYYYILKAFDGTSLVGRPQTGVIHLFGN